MRGQLKRKLAGKRLSPLWIMDTCCGLSNNDDKSMSDKLSGLKEVMASDGVHLTKEGYKNVAMSIVDTVVKVQSGVYGKSAVNSGSVAVSVAGTGRTYQWHGFVSPVGSKLPRERPGWGKSSRGKLHESVGPYRKDRWGRGGSKF